MDACLLADNFVFSAQIAWAVVMGLTVFRLGELLAKAIASKIWK